MDGCWQPTRWSNLLFLPSHRLLVLGKSFMVHSKVLVEILLECLAASFVFSEHMYQKHTFGKSTLARELPHQDILPWITAFPLEHLLLVEMPMTWSVHRIDESPTCHFFPMFSLVPFLPMSFLPVAFIPCHFYLCHYYSLPCIRTHILFLPLCT